jgi:hypothetical protein
MIKTEPKRLATVRKFEHLRLDDNIELKALVTLTTQICNTRMALLNLMDEHVQLARCASGISSYEENRENTFCQYLINSDKMMVVKDALLDKRFINIPLVREKSIRFYAGVPLITSNGYHLGVLCVLDTEPHTLTSKQKEMMTFIAKQVLHMMEMLLGIDFFKQHHLNTDIKNTKSLLSGNKLKAFFYGSNSCHLIIDKALHVIELDKDSALKVKNQYAKQIRAGKNILDFITSSLKKDFLKYIKLAFNGKQTNKEILISTDEKNPQWWDVRFAPVLDDHGNTISVAYSAANINKQKLQLAEILSQNQSLLKIAHIQSHEYRKPVASILGLMNVIKANHYRSPKKCLLMMEIAVKELDEKIRSVVNHAQNKAS